MFEALTNKFNDVFRKMSGRGRTSEENVKDAMREVRQALLEADVHYKVVRDFAESIVRKAKGQEVIKSLHPGQMMIKIVHDELVALMGPVDTHIYYVSPPPTVIMKFRIESGINVERGVGIVPAAWYQVLEVGL
jgi:signal recognition particle subunit SRP54